MTFKEYTPLAIRTECDYGFTFAFCETAPVEPDGEPLEWKRRWRLSHACIGLATEAFELLATNGRVNTKEELGDLCWYAAVGLDALGAEIAGSIGHLTQASHEQLTSSICNASNSALDHLKKVMFYGIDMDGSFLVSQFVSTLVFVDMLAIKNGWTLAEVLQANINKLRVRYPEKFSGENATNRNIAAETAALSR